MTNIVPEEVHPEILRYNEQWRRKRDLLYDLIRPLFGRLNAFGERCREFGMSITTTELDHLLDQVTPGPVGFFIENVVRYYGKRIASRNDVTANLNLLRIVGVTSIGELSLDQVEQRKGEPEIQSDVRAYTIHELENLTLTVNVEDKAIGLIDHLSHAHGWQFINSIPDISTVSDHNLKHLISWAWANPPTDFFRSLLDQLSDEQASRIAERQLSSARITATLATCLALVSLAITCAFSFLDWQGDAAWQRQQVTSAKEQTAITRDLFKEAIRTNTLINEVSRKLANRQKRSKNPTKSGQSTK